MHTRGHTRSPTCRGSSRLVRLIAGATRTIVSPRRRMPEKCPVEISGEGVVAEVAAHSLLVRPTTDYPTLGKHYPCEIRTHASLEAIIERTVKTRATVSVRHLADITHSVNFPAAPRFAGSSRTLEAASDLGSECIRAGTGFTGMLPAPVLKTRSSHHCRARRMYCRQNIRLGRWSAARTCGGWWWRLQWLR